MNDNISTIRKPENYIKIDAMLIKFKHTIWVRLFFGYSWKWLDMTLLMIPQTAKSFKYFCFVYKYVCYYDYFDLLCKLFRYLDLLKDCISRFLIYPEIFIIYVGDSLLFVLIYIAVMKIYKIIIPYKCDSRAFYVNK